MNGQRENYCGLEGEEDEAVATGRFNRWIAMAMRHHVTPAKQQLVELQHTLNAHIREDELMQAKILGGLKVLAWMMPALAVIIPALVSYIIYLMMKAGAIQ